LGIRSHPISHGGNKEYQERVPDNRSSSTYHSASWGCFFINFHSDGDNLPL
jgi:hypothetical protein